MLLEDNNLCINETEESENQISQSTKTKKNYRYGIIFFLVIVIVVSLSTVIFITSKNIAKENRERLEKERLEREKLEREKLENFFESPENTPIIEFYSNLVQQMDIISNDYLFSDETTSRLRRLYSSELEELDNIANHLPKFKANTQKIKDLIEGSFFNQICKYLGIVAKPTVLLANHLFDQITLRKKIVIKNSKDIKNSLSIDLNLLKSIPELASSFLSAKDSKISYLTNLGLSLVSLGFSIHDTVEKLDTLDDIVANKNYEGDFNLIRSYFLYLIEEIKKVPKITEESTEEEIKKAIQKLGEIGSEITRARRELCGLIKDIQEEIEYIGTKLKDMEEKKKMSKISSIINGVGCIFRAVVAFEPEFFVKASTYFINIANGKIAEKNWQDYYLMLEYLNKALESSQELLEDIKKAQNLVSKMINDLNARNID